MGVHATDILKDTVLTLFMISFWISPKASIWLKPTQKKCDSIDKSAEPWLNAIHDLSQGYSKGLS